MKWIVFVTDVRPDAYERLVDRLLASPAYGERWARHWLDVIHFAETHGHDQDAAARQRPGPTATTGPQPSTWTNPIRVSSRSRWPATCCIPTTPTASSHGLLSAGPWDESSQKDIRDDTIDKKQAQNLDRDDMATTVLTAFCSTTIHCARCQRPQVRPHQPGGILRAAGRLRRRRSGQSALRPRPHHPPPPPYPGAAPRANPVGPGRDPRDPGDPSATWVTWEQEQRRQQWHMLKPDTAHHREGLSPDEAADDSVRFGGGPRPRQGRLHRHRRHRPHGGHRRPPRGADRRRPASQGPRPAGQRQPAPQRVQRRARPRDQAKGHLAGNAPLSHRDGRLRPRPAGRRPWPFDGKPATAWGIYPAVGAPAPGLSSPSPGRWRCQAASRSASSSNRPTARAT